MRFLKRRKRVKKPTVIGKVESIESTEQGLIVTGQLNDEGLARLSKLGIIDIFVAGKESKD